MNLVPRIPSLATSRDGVTVVNLRRFRGAAAKGCPVGLATSAHFDPLRTSAASEFRSAASP
jgi:hypothetical protein